MPLVLRALALNLALCAMALRALLPDGWMPAGGGNAHLTICSVEHAPAGSHAPAHPGDHRAHGVCPFAAAAPLASDGHSIAVALLVSEPARHLTTRGEVAPRAPPTSLHQARAPPIPSEA